MPQAAELAAPIRSFAEDSANPGAPGPDPDGKINRDSKGLIDVEVTVVPPRVSPGDSAQIHIQFCPTNGKVHWNNESEPLRLWVDAPDGWQLSRRLLSAPVGDEPESHETRMLDLEAKPTSAAIGKARLNAYALYYVCENAGGHVCFSARTSRFQSRSTDEFPRIRVLSYLESQGP